MSGDQSWMRDMLNNSPGLRNAINMGAESDRMRRQVEETSQMIDEANEARWAQEEEDRERDRQHLEESRRIAANLERMNDQLDQQQKDAEEVARRDRNRGRWALVVSVIAAAAAVAAVVAPFIQSGG